MGACVFIGQGPVEGGNVQAALSVWDELQPGAVGGWMSDGGVELEPHRDALHQNYSVKIIKN